MTEVISVAIAKEAASLNDPIRFSIGNKKRMHTEKPVVQTRPKIAIAVKDDMDAAVSSFSILTWLNDTFRCPM